MATVGQSFKLCLIQRSNLKRKALVLHSWIIRKSEYTMGDLVLIAQPLPESQVNAPALLQFNPTVSGGEHMGGSVFNISDPALVEDMMLTQDATDHKGHAIAVDSGILKQ